MTLPSCPPLSTKAERRGININDQCKIINFLIYMQIPVSLSTYSQSKLSTKNQKKVLTITGICNFEEAKKKIPY